MRVQTTFPTLDFESEMWARPWMVEEPRNSQRRSMMDNTLQKKPKRLENMHILGLSNLVLSVVSLVTCDIWCIQVGSWLYTKERFRVVQIALNSKLSEVVA